MAYTYVIALKIPLILYRLILPILLCYTIIIALLEDSNNVVESVSITQWIHFRGSLHCQSWRGAIETR